MSQARDSADEPTLGNVTVPLLVAAGIASEGLGEQRLGDRASPLQAGAEIGPYRLLRLLGRGGMGEVFLAEQQRPVRREVALKLIQRRLSSPLAIARFQVERQVLAELQHPRIAKLYDAGTSSDGFPYFVMEYVDGDTLTGYCESHRLDLSARLALFRSLCAAVHHAHQRGIVHRDLKPANVLVTEVDGQPRPMIIDFGIATVTRGRGLHGEAVREVISGTPQYMSPEQLEPELQVIDLRSDVYALGVILFELLTGTQPVDSSRFDASDAARLLELLRSQSPRTLDEVASATVAGPEGRLLRVELTGRRRAEMQAIVQRAMARDRDQRYASALALAEDLEAFEQHRPVRAMAPTRGYLLRCFARRQRVPLAAAAAFVLVLLGGLAATLWALAQAREQRGLAEEAAALARDEAERANQVAFFLRDLLASIDPAEARDMDRSLLRRILDDAAARVARDLAPQPAVAGALLETIADSYLALALDEPAEDALQAAAALIDDATGRLELRRGRIDMLRGEFEAMEQRLTALLARQQALLPADDPLLVETRLLLGWALREQRRPVEAEQWFAALARELEAARGLRDRQTMAAWNQWAITLDDLGRSAESEAVLRPLLAVSRELLGADHPDTVATQQSLAVSLMQQDRHAEAIEPLREAYALRARRLDPGHPGRLYVASQLAGALRGAGRPQEAEPYYREAMEGWRARLAADAPQVLQTTHNHALVEIDLGRAAAALETLLDLREPWLRVFGASSMPTAVYTGSLGHALLQSGRIEEGRAEIAAAHALFEALGLGPEHTRRQRLDNYLDRAPR